jgi:hypothetical protein
MRECLMRYHGTSSLLLQRIASQTLIPHFEIPNSPVPQVTVPQFKVQEQTSHTHSKSKAFVY